MVQVIHSRRRPRKTRRRGPSIRFCASGRKGQEAVLAAAKEPFISKGLVSIEAKQRIRKMSSEVHDVLVHDLMGRRSRRHHG